MPRKKYPSDHRRYFRVMEDILDDPKLAQCPPSACWLFIQILALLNRTKSRDGTLLLPARSFNSLTGRDRNATESLLSRLQLAQILRFERQGKSTLIEVFKWPKHQGFSPARLRQDSDQTPPPTPTPNYSLFERDGKTVSRSPLANLLTNPDGEKIAEDEKRAWLEAEGPTIEAEADLEAAKATPDRRKAVKQASVKRITIRYWRHYLRGERQYRGVDDRKRRRAAAEAWEREHGESYAKEMEAT